MRAPRERRGGVRLQRLRSAVSGGPRHGAQTQVAAGQPFLFTGRRFDFETGLYYYRARYYSAPLGRFLQTDPVGYEDQMNLYAYVGNDPVNAWDPSGLAQCDLQGQTGDLKGDDCKNALDDSENARNKALAGAQTLNGIADKLDKDPTGRTLSAAERILVDVVKNKFGKEYGSSKNLRSVAEGLNKIASKIGVRGKGAVLMYGDNARNSRGFIPRAYAVNGGVYFNKSFLLDKDEIAREQTIVHEGGHLAGFLGDIYAGSLGRQYGGLSVEGAVAYNDSLPEGMTTGRYRLENNADSYACSIIDFQEECK